MAQAGQPFTFKGGDLSDLVAAIADQKHENVVALASFPVDIKKFEITPEMNASPKDFSRLMFAKSGFHAEDKDGVSVFDGTLSSEGQVPWKYMRDPRNLNPKVRPILPDAVKDSKITLKSTSAGAYVVGDLTKLPWDKPLTVYWSFEGFPIRCRRP